MLDIVGLREEMMPTPCLCSHNSLCSLAFIDINCAKQILERSPVAAFDPKTDAQHDIFISFSI